MRKRGLRGEGGIRGPPDHWPIARDLQEIASSPGESQKLPRAPTRRICAIYSDFSGSVGIRRKRGPTCPGGGAEICDPADQLPISYDLQEIARFPAESRILFRRPRAVALRRLPGCLGNCRNSATTGPMWRGGGRNTRSPGSAVDCGGSSGNIATSRWISETPTVPHRGVFAPFTRISRNCRNSAKTRRTWCGVGDTRPPGPSPIAYDLRRISETAPGAPRGGFAPLTRISRDLLG